MQRVHKIWKRVKRIIYHTRRILCEFSNLLFLRPLECYYSWKISKIDQTTEVFMLSRSDFGIFALHVHYISLWQKYRSQTCVVVLTTQHKVVKTLLEQISPETQVIYVLNPIIRFYTFLFGIHVTQSYLYFPLYAWLSFKWMNRHEIFVQPAEAKDQKIYYSQYLDPHFRTDYPQPNFSRNAYIRLRERTQLDYESYLDCVRLSKSNPPISTFPHLKARFNTLNRRMGSDRPYILLNLNCKTYVHPQQNSRRIHYPQNYSDSIDFLIDAGYQVVVQGRNEQYEFAPRAGLINYFKMKERSLENDLALFANCAWFITCRTGPEVLPLFFDKPVLGLSYTECWHLMPYKKFRLFPKHVVELKSGRPIPWKKLLDHPSLYCFGSVPHDPDVEYRDLNPDEILQGVMEFHKVLQEDAWDSFTERQLEFKRSLTPYHMDLFYTEAVPLDTYLQLPYQVELETSRA